MSFRWAFALAPSLLIPAGLGCTGDDDVDDRRIVQTGVVVDPAEFLGDLPCADVEGAPKAYVATVVELADETQPERLLGPSEPVSCGTPIVFTDIRGGRRYGARISVFDVAADQAKGATPAWTTECGLTGAGSAEIFAGRQTRIRGCTAIEGAGTGTTSIVVDANEAVGALGCAADGGAIGEIQIVPVEPLASGLPTVTVACGQAPIVYGTAIEPGVKYAFRLEAESADGGTLGAQCSAVARAGLGVPATCTLLLDTGSLSFPIPALVEEAGFVCGDSVSRATVSAVGADLTVPSASVPCNADAFASSLPPGAYSGTIALYAGPDLAASFTCAGEVVPGVTTVLSCIPN